MNKKILFLVILIFESISLYSHPHNFINARVEFVFQDDKIIGFWSDWEFDDFFTSDIVMGFDLDNNAVFDENETDEIYNNAFISLEDYDYFTYIRVNDKRWSPDKVEDFTPYINENGKVVYRFYIDLTENNSKDFYVSIYDFTYFVACFYNDTNPVSFKGNSGITPNYSIDKNEDYPVFFDPYAGIDDLTVHTEWKEGLVELVIQEIHIEY